jgi:hypothetical protein
LAFPRLRRGHHDRGSGHPSDILDAVSEPYPADAKKHLEIAARKLEEMRLRAHHPPRHFWTLSGMVEAWRELVAHIEEGYDDIIEEYSNDLSVRDLLDELLAVIPEGSVRSWVTKEIEQADQRYRDATREVDKPIFGSGEMAWWWKRVPIVLVGELRRDLEGTTRD